MITPRLRPKFDLQVPRPPAELAERMTALLAHPNTPCRGLASTELIELRIRESDRHYWSPQLVVILKPTPDGCAMTGRFGPNANVWTMFMACYGFVVLCAIVATFYGLSQIVLRESPWALWALPIAAGLIILIYIAAGIGQRLGHDQADILYACLRSATDERDEGEHDER